MIDSGVQRIAFFVWHAVLMRVSLLIGVLMPCILINSFRGTGS